MISKLCAVFLALLWGASCQKLGNRADRTTVDCGLPIDSDRVFVQFEDPYGKILEAKDLQVIDPLTGQKTAKPALTSKGCLLVDPNANWIVRAVGQPWFTRVTAASATRGAILRLKASEPQQLTVSCNDTLQVNKSMSLEQVLNVSRVIDPNNFLVQYSLNSKLETQNFILDFSTTHPVFNPDHQPGGYELKISITDTVGSVRTEYACRLELDESAPTIALSYGPETFADYRGMHFHKIDRKQRLNFVRLDNSDSNDIQYIEYCAVPYPTFESFRSAPDKICDKPQRTNDILSQITATNEGFWIIRHHTVDVAKNDSGWSAPYPLVYFHGDEFLRLEKFADQDFINGALARSGGAMRILKETLDAIALRKKELKNEYERALADQFLFNAFGSIYDRMPLFIEAKRVTIPDGTFAGLFVYPDDQYFITGSSEGRIRRWNLASGTLTGDMIETYTDPISSMIPTPDMNSILIADRSGGLALWDLTSLQQISEFWHMEGNLRFVNHAAFSPNGQQLVTSTFLGELLLWDVKTFQPLLKDYIADSLPTSNEIIQASVSLSDDGRIQAFLGTGEIQFYSPNAESPSGYEKSSFPKDAKDRVPFKSWMPMPDGKTVLVTTDKTAEYWDMSQGFPVKGKTAERFKGISGLRSAGGEWLAGMESDKKLRIYDRLSGRIVQNDFPSDLVENNSYSFSRDKKTLFTVSDWNQLSFWVQPPSIGRELSTYWEPEGYNAMAIDPHGSQLYAGNNAGEVVIFDRRDGKFLRKVKIIDDMISALAVSPDGLRLAIGGINGKLCVLNLKDSADSSSCFAKQAGGAAQLDFSDNRTILAVDPAGLKAYDIASDNPNGVILAAEPGRLFVLYDQGSKVIIAKDQKLQAWDLKSSRSIGNPLQIPGKIGSLAIDRSGKYLAAGSSDKDFQIIIFDLNTLTQYGSFPAHRDLITGLDFIGNGLLVSSSYDKLVKVWDIHHQEALMTLTRHSDWVPSIIHGDSPTSFYTASWDGTIRTWDLDFSQLPNLICEKIGAYLPATDPSCQGLTPSAKDR